MREFFLVKSLVQFFFLYVKSFVGHYMIFFSGLLALTQTYADMVEGGEGHLFHCNTFDP